MQTYLKRIAKKNNDPDFDSKGTVKILCIPFDQPEISPSDVCFISGEKPTAHVIWGRSY